jgi:hypothetical protein
MSYIKILQRLDLAVYGRDPRVAQQLRAGLSTKQIARWLKKIPGDTAPLVDLYAWHDGTEPLRWSEGETHKFSLLELSIVPNELCIFERLERAATTFLGWAEIAKYHSRIKEAVNRYFPILWDGSDTWFCIDINPGERHRVIYFELQNDSPFREAYPTFEEFLTDVLHVNETGESLRFFEEGLSG